ncbi:hypothetical protein HID58_057753 [Brassica napus]|uniref:Uncharacterized protein n=1 Tax=Brassica napus TaxID=3708 RepID=A0ABQ7XFJ1_BRANA|nr:hypothetical protein HID58_057753 [Brassica napus]
MIKTHNQALMSKDNDDDEAICKRTRASCSLASSTLDDLEAFLHETDDDDEDEISNVDEEKEEYRKFLAATVSHSCEVQDCDYDEDKDVDFEIQQALETDDEEASIPRPVTRRKRRPKISNDCRSRSLRPLVPIFPITQPRTRFYAARMNGCFSQAQIRELHCLVLDHLQLLIQVYSLCAFDHSKQRIGAQVQGLITEMVQKQQRPSHLLDLVGRYLVDDVSTAVQEYRKRQVESGFDSMFGRVPLFESGRKDPGTVHKDVAELAQVFLPFFKVSLFLRSRLEEAIKQRFLPCKSEHQIFIRKKNKGASKAFENPVKAALRMKNSKKNNEACTQRLAPCVFPLGMRKPHKKSVGKLEYYRENDSGLLMHHLLFRTPEHTTTSAESFNNSPREIDHSAELGDSCFHPFLRKSEYEMSRRENLEAGTGKNAKLCQLEDTLGAGDKTCIPVAGRNDGSHVTGSSATSRCIDEIGDQSNQGIVMEHEELSDSDQEMMEEEHVEFECEEMTDSQGENDSECEEEKSDKEITEALG